MNAWRNILTALWCAILGGNAAFLLYQSGVPLSALGDMPAELAIAVILSVVFCVCSLLALIYVPALIGSVISVLGLVGIALANGIGGLVGYGGGIILLQTGLLAALIVTGSLGFVFWDRAHKSGERKASFEPTGEF